MINAWADTYLTNPCHKLPGLHLLSQSWTGWYCQATFGYVHLICSLPFYLRSNTIKSNQHVLIFAYFYALLFRGQNYVPSLSLASSKDPNTDGHVHKDLGFAIENLLQMEVELTNSPLSWAGAVKSIT